MPVSAATNEELAALRLEVEAQASQLAEMREVMNNLLWYTPALAANLLQVHVKTVRYLCISGQLDATKRGRQWIISVRGLLAYRERQRRTV
jgi:excisionase family DNA binding protein